MMDPSRQTHGAARHGGFTLIELLLVMFVMSVLVALVVGVGSYVIESARKEETTSAQDRIMGALAAFHQVTNDYPAGDPLGAGSLIPTFRGDAVDWANSTAYKVGDVTRDNLDASIWVCKIAHTSSAVPKSFAQDRATYATYWQIDRTRTKIFRATKPFLGDSGSATTADAYGIEMRYYRDRGVGGKPLLLSAGPDQDFGDTNENKREDNIRSDTRE